MLPQRVRIERLQRQGDGRGGFETTPVEVAASQRCRLKGASLRTFVDTDGQLVSEVQIEAYFDPDADLKPQDVLTEIATGRHLIVHSTDRQADGVYRKAFLTEEQA